MRGNQKYRDPLKEYFGFSVTQHTIENHSDSPLNKFYLLIDNWLYAQLHYFLNFSQLLVSCLTIIGQT